MKYAIEWLKTRSMDQINHAFFLYEGLMNIAFASEKTQNRILTTQLKSPFFDSHKTEIALTTAHRRCFNRIQNNLSYINRDKEAIWRHYYGWKRSLAEAFKGEGYKLAMKQRTTLQQSLTVDDYALFHEFHYRFTTQIPHQSALFDLKNYVLDVANYLLCLDTMQHGFGHEGFDKLAIERVFTQSDSFFEGHVFDFFVHDRHAHIENRANRFIVSYKDRISTHIFNTLESAKQKMDDRYQFVMSI